jgi:hypothetical protein
MKTGFLRAIAFAIAAAGVVDPVITISRPVKPEVALVADKRLPDPGLVDRVADGLGPQFNIVRGPSFGAAAVVSVGYQLSQRDVGAAGGAERRFAVVPEPRSPFVAIASAAAPGHALLQARTPVDVRVRTVAARGKTLTVTLRRDGVAVDVATLTIQGDDTVEHARLESVATAPGVVTLDVDAQIEGSTAAGAEVKLTQNVRDERWSVLSFDRRPSWMATFVRRALETDPRFVVTSRVATSRGAPAVTAGDPPAVLSTLPSLELFQTVIVGAPEDLTADDEAGLTRLMRQRGGSVVLLLDQSSSAAHSTAFRSLTGIPGWVLRERAEPWGTPSASATLTPAALPEWAEPEEPASAKPGEPPTVWRTSVGRGSLVVSGALDAWRFRDANDQAFGAYWRGVIARAGEAASLSGAAAPAPTSEPDERKLVDAWAHSRGGRIVRESELGTLAPALAESLSPVTERRPYRPMQSAWWMVPFAAALGFEWWSRRRRGLR